MPKIVAEKVDWIKLGFRQFAEKGELGINVDQMAQALQCNRSSFYWHFTSKEEFIKQVIDYWTDIDTIQIIEFTNKERTTKEKFKTLIEIVFKKDPYMDFVFHLKRYARKKDFVQKTIDDIDQQRIQFVADLIVELGISKDVAFSKANIMYKYLIGHHEMIRYANQDPNYIEQVYSELKQFIPLEN